MISGSKSWLLSGIPGGALSSCIVRAPLPSSQMKSPSLRVEPRHLRFLSTPAFVNSEGQPELKTTGMGHFHQSSSCTLGFPSLPRSAGQPGQESSRRHPLDPRRCSFSLNTLTPLREISLWCKSWPHDNLLGLPCCLWSRSP